MIARSPGGTVSDVYGRRSSRLSYEDQSQNHGVDAIGLSHGMLILVKPLPAYTRFAAADGSCRYLITLGDGEVVESVLILQGNRSTFCISSQVGCALACRFCLTGRLGLTRNLSAEEMVSQVSLLRHEIASRPSGRFSVVLMGMGEPLQNFTGRCAPSGGVDSGYALEDQPDPAQ